MVKRYEQPNEPPEESKAIHMAEFQDSVIPDAFADSYMGTVESLNEIGVPAGHELAGPMFDVNGEKHDVFPHDIESIEPVHGKPHLRKVAMIGGTALFVTVAGLVFAKNRVGQRRSR